MYNGIRLHGLLKRKEYSRISGIDRALFTKTICLNPRYSISLIGGEAFSNLEEAAAKASGEFTSGVVVMPGEFDILDHPMCRFVVVRPVARLEESLKYLHQGVSMVGVYPEERRLELRDRILAKGVSSVLPLGQGERFFAGMPHDGRLVLSQLVDWKNA